MMYSPFKCKLLLGVFLIFLLHPMTGKAIYIIPGTDRAAKDTGKSAVLLYNTLDKAGEEREDVVSLYSMLRTYCSTVSMLEINEYRTGLLKDAHYVFITGGVRTEVNDSLGRDLMNFDGVIGWVGGGLEKYTGYGFIKGFDIESYSGEIAELSYAFKSGNGSAERILTGRRKNIPRIRITDKSMIQSYGTITTGTESFPYAVQSGKVWCFSLFEKSGEGGAVFHQMLNRIFTEEQGEKTGVYIKIDNVSPFVDFQKLKDTAGWLEAEGVPFIMELRPVFSNTDYEHMKRFAALIRELQGMGGTAVLGNLQGWKPPDDWQQYVEGASPLSGSESMVPERLLSTSFKAYLQYGVYPVAFAGPADAFFDPELSAVFKHFSTFIQSGSWKGYSASIQPEAAWTGKFVPSLMTDTSSKEIGQGLSEVYAEIEKAGSGAFALGFDCLSGLEDLKKSVSKLKNMGVKLEDFRKLDSKVEFESINLAVKDREFTINGESSTIEEKIEENRTDPAAGKPAELPGVTKRIRQIMTFVIFIAGIFIFLFVLAFIAGKRIDRKKHLR